MTDRTNPPRSKTGPSPGLQQVHEERPSPCCARAAENNCRFCPGCGKRLQPEPEQRKLLTDEGAPDKTAGPAVPTPCEQTFEEVQPVPEKEPTPRPSPVSPATPELPPAPSTPPSPPQDTVCDCGRKLRPDARYCDRCGLSVGSAKPVPRLQRVQDGRPGPPVEMTGDELMVGKDPDCDLSMPDDGYVSRRHARISRSEGMTYLEDLGSSNGTFLKVRRPIILEPGDEILLGTSVLRFDQS